MSYYPIPHSSVHSLFFKNGNESLHVFIVNGAAVSSDVIGKSNSIAFSLKFTEILSKIFLFSDEEFESAEQSVSCRQPESKELL